MGVFMGAFPVLEGKDDDGRKFAQETRDRGEEFAASQKRFGLTREEWSLQQTPMGSLVIVRFEGDDVGAALEGFGQSSDEFDVWFKGRVKEITGVDLSEPMPGPLPEIIFDWSS
jgi:hypothetical protein